jgi:hypothetical protein
MNKFSLLLVTFVVFGGIVASNVNVQTTAHHGIEVDPNVKVTPAQYRFVPEKVEVIPGHVDVTPAQVQVTPAHSELIQAKVEVGPMEVRETVPAIVSVKDVPTETVVNAAPATVGQKISHLKDTVVEKAKEVSSESNMDKVKAFFANGASTVKQGLLTAKYYVFGDVLADWLVRKEYIADANKSVFSSCSLFTPRHVINFAALVLLVNGTFYAYQALKSQNEDEDDFYLKDEDLF